MTDTLVYVIFGIGVVVLFAGIALLKHVADSIDEFRRYSIEDARKISELKKSISALESIVDTTLTRGFLLQERE